MQRSAAFVDDVGSDRGEADGAARPVGGRGPLTGAQHGESGGCQRQQPVDDRAVEAGRVAKGVGDEDRETEDDSADHRHQSADLGGRRSRRLDDQQRDEREDAGYCGRPTAATTGSSPRTAILVSGRLKLNTNTPRPASTNPIGREGIDGKSPERHGDPQPKMGSEVARAIVPD